MSSSSFVIHYAEDDLGKQSLAAFVTSFYMPKYNTVPPMVHYYAWISRGDVPLACMGVELPRTDGSFQIEHAYKINRATAPLPFTTENCVQLNRWASDNRQAGMLAVLGAVTLALKLGKRFALVEHDTGIHEHCKRTLGVEFWTPASSPVNLEEIPEENRVFYAEGTLCPYLVNLEQMKSALTRKTENLNFTGLYV